MNERIKEIAEQAGGFVSQSYEHENKLILSGAETIDKFAKLLVKECGQYLNSPEFIGRSDLDWSMLLNEHFGVEE